MITELIVSEPAERNSSLNDGHAPTHQRRRLREIVLMDQGAAGEVIV